jgi:hypothetical protein
MDHTDARRAMQLVLTKYDKYLSTTIKNHSRLSDVRSIFYFVNWTQFKSAFDLFYGKFFRKALGVTSSNNEVDPACVGAFVTPHPIHTRIIYVKKEFTGATGHYFGNFSTLTHEFIHFLSNEEFYPKFYETGGAAPDQVEGVTEMLTRSISSQIALQRTSYNRQYQWFKSWAVDEDSGNFQAMANYCFNGMAVALPNGNSPGLTSTSSTTWTGWSWLDSIINKITS